MNDKGMVGYSMIVECVWVKRPSKDNLLTPQGAIR